MSDAFSTTQKPVATSGTLSTCLPRMMTAPSSGPSFGPTRSTFAPRGRAPAFGNAQYMGRPSTEGGNLLREQWFGEFYLPSKYSEIVVAYDCAEKVGLSNDYTACVVIGTKSTGYDVLHVHRSKMEITDLIRDIDNRMGWVQASFPDTPISLAIEDKSAGTSVIQIIRKERSYNLFPIAAHRRNEKELRVL